MKIKNYIFAAALASGPINAQILLNPGFETSNLNNWLSASTDGGGLGNNPLSNAFTVGTLTYLDGDVANLGNRMAFLNTTATRTSASLTAAVFQNDGTSAQLIAEGDDLQVIAALGNRTGGGSSNFRDSADATISIGYLTTPGDLSTFTPIDSTFYGADTEINTIGDNTFADFDHSTTITAGSAAIGQQFAVRFEFTTPGTIPPGSTSNRQSILDHVRVSTGGVVVADFAATPDATLGAEDVTLSWTTSDAGRIEITDDQGSSPIIYTATADGQPFLDSGMVTIPDVSTETVYTLSATKAENGSGTPVTQTVTATIQQSAPDVTLVAAPSISNGASDVTLYFNTTVIEEAGAEVFSGGIEGFGESGGLASNQVRDTDVADFATILTGGPYIFEVTNGEIAGTQYDITGFSGNVLTVDGTPATDGLLWTDYRIVESSTYRGTDSLTISDGATTVFSSTDPSVIASGSVTISNVNASTTFTATATFPGGGSTQDDASFTVTGDGSSYEETVLAQNPIGYYRFEESLNSPTIYDSSGNEAHSVAIDNAQFLTSGSAGIIGNGGTFAEPATVGAAVVTGVSLNPSTSSWSITALTKPDELFTEDLHIVSNRDGSGTGRSLLVIDDDTAILKSFAGGVNTPDITNSTIVENTDSYIENAVCHVAITYDMPNTTLSIYLDGTLIGQRTDISPQSASGAWVIGAHKSNNANLFWDGILDEVAFFDTALTQTNITAQNNAFLSETPIGILAFGNRDITISQGQSTDLIVKVGGNANSATIDNGVGAVAVGASSSVTVSPSTTTTYTLNVDGELQTVTITVVPAITTITITASGFDGSGNYFIDVAEGVAGFKVTTSPDLETPFTDATGVSNDGANRFTISAGSLDSNADGKDFFRVEIE